MGNNKFYKQYQHGHQHSTSTKKFERTPQHSSYVAIRTNKVRRTVGTVSSVRTVEDLDSRPSLAPLGLRPFHINALFPLYAQYALCLKRQQKRQTPNTPNALFRIQQR